MFIYCKEKKQKLRSTVLLPQKNCVCLIVDFAFTIRTMLTYCRLSILTVSTLTLNEHPGETRNDCKCLPNRAKIHILVLQFCVYSATLTQIFQRMLSRIIERNQTIFANSSLLFFPSLTYCTANLGLVL